MVGVALIFFRALIAPTLDWDIQARFFYFQLPFFLGGTVSQV
jgi:hypothetical protein